MRLIDADRLYELIDGNVPAPYEDSREAKEECLNMIADAYTIDAVPVVHGHWITTEHDSVKCSICGNNEDVWWADTGTNYCPNCGAKMDEVNENRFYFT